MTRRPPPAPRGGFGLTEALAGLLLTLLLVTLLSAAAAGGRRALAEIARDVEEVEASRVARTLLTHVARSGRLHAQTSAGLRPDEIGVDFPVGTAEPCDTVWVWRGVRAPDAGRDSAVVLDDRARVWRTALTAAYATTCGAGEARGLSTDPSVPGAVHIAVFESGVVRVDEAVRYARAGTPRQPLTAAVLDGGLSHVARAGTGGAVRVTLQVARDTLRIWSRSWPAR